MIDLNKVYQFAYLAIVWGTARDDIYQIRLDSLISVDKEKSYDLVVNIRSMKVLEYFGPPYRKSPKPLFMKGLGFQVHYTTIAYKQDIQETYRKELSYVSFPTLELIQQTMDAEWLYSNMDKETLNPRTSPMISVIMGPEYFSIWSLKQYPNNISEVGYKEDRDHRLHEIGTKLLPRVIAMASKKSPNVDRIMALYDAFGIRLDIRKYTHPLSYYEV